MARSSTRQSTTRDGFTLIELLVVIAIAAILVTLAVLSFNLIDDDRAVSQEAVKLSSLIEVVSEEAQMQGRDYGLEFMQSGYRFVEYDPYLDAWNEVADDDLLIPRALDDGMVFELFLEDHRVLLQAEAAKTQSEDDDGDRDLTDDYLPHVLIMASGDISPFELEVVRLIDETKVGLSMELGGDLEIARHDQDL